MELHDTYTPEALDHWKGLAREAIPLAKEQRICSYGRQALNRACVIMDQPITAPNVTMVIRLKNIVLPDGITFIGNAGYKAEIKDRDGNLVATVPLNEELDDRIEDEEDDDLDDDEDDLDDDY